MAGKEKFPVAVENVVYLNGEPPQDVLASVAREFVSDETELQSRRDRFSSVLERHGRPHGTRHIETYYGMRLIDLIAAGDGVLRRAQWFLCDGDPPIIEGHGREIEGWWAEGGDQVLFHVAFGRGLTIKETACVLAESATPAEALVDAITKLYEVHKDDDLLDPTASAIALLPTAVREHVSPAFTLCYREARLDLYFGTGEEDGCVFDLRESWTLLDMQREGFGM